MIYQVPDIQREVRICIDMNMSDASLLDEGDMETLALDDIIRSKIEDAARMVVSIAPADKLGTGKNMVSDDDRVTGQTMRGRIYWNSDNKSGYLYLPTDYMRFVAFKMSDWERAVYEALDTRSADLAKQSSRHKGLRGTVEKPVVAIVPRAEGLALEFYSTLSNSATVERAVYIPAPAIEESTGGDDEGIDLPKECYRAFIYCCAALTVTAYNDKEMSAQMMEIATNLLGATKQ